MKYDIRAFFKGPWPWAVLVLVIVMVLPVVTFLRNKTLQKPSAPRQQRTYSHVAFGGYEYSGEKVLSLPFNGGSAGLEWKLASDIPVHSVEVIAPSPDGKYLWVVDHPDTGARVRRYTMGGRLVSTFRTPGGTLFTPGVKGDIWADYSAGSGGSEVVVHYDSKGKELGRYPLPKGVFARTLSVAADGRVFALNEEWLLDPTARTGYYSGALIPVADPAGKPVIIERGDAKKASFVGADNNTYSLEGTTSVDSSVFPTASITVTDPQGTFVRFVESPEGYRPFAADATGRIYTEYFAQDDGAAKGVTTIGDVVAETKGVLIISPDGTRSEIPVQRYAYTGFWAPAAWPDSQGNIYSARITDSGIDVFVSRPGTASVPIADSRPGLPDARIMYSGSAPRTGDPYFAADARERDLWHLVYSGLVSHDASLNVVPDLCEKVPSPGDGISEDGRTITWRIVSGRTWHDGTSVSARDVVATWEYLNRPTTVYPQRPFPGFDYIQRVEARGDEVVVQLRAPFGAAPECFFPFVLPAHIVEDSGNSVNGGLHSAPLGSGPFALKRWERGAWMLEAHAPSKASAFINVLDVQFDSDKGRQGEYMGAQVPTVWVWVPPADASNVRRDAVGELLTAATGRWKGIIFNSAEEPMNDARVRKALAESLPYHELRPLYVASGNTSATAGAFAIQGVEPVGVPATATLSPRRAEELLESAGWARSGEGPRTKGGKPLPTVFSQTARFGSHEVLDERVTAVLDTWGRLGAKTSWKYGQIGYYQALTLPGTLARGAFTIAGGTYPGFLDPAWGSVFDPADAPSRTNPRGVAITYSRDARLQELHAQARRTYDRAERARLADEITKRVLELDLAVFEAAESRDTAVLGVSGIKPAPYPAGDFWNVADWRVEAK